MFLGGLGEGGEEGQWAMGSGQWGREEGVWRGLAK